MNDSLEHRGPDEEGSKILKQSNIVVGLGHRRLSIIDLAAGQQPMSNEDATIWITYNGEIYNHAELRRELEALGHRYRTRSDTETIIHAYEEWGTQCVCRLRGMFAFVVWDDRKQQLFAARDRLGIKPIYYTGTGDTFLCASEIKALIASGWQKPEINMDAVPEYVTFGYMPGEQTLFRGIVKLMPGHVLIWKNGNISTSRYWDIPLPDGRYDNTSEDEVVNEFERLFRESVRMRLMSDVPLGVFLSGGLDSSAIAVTMTQHMTEPLKTFSVGFESEYYSEFDFAREVASAIGAEHHEVILRPGEFFSSLPKLIWHEDEPIRFASSIALHQVAQLASKHVKVVLTGEGGDELFAGYDRYWATMFNLRYGPLYERAVPQWIREHCIRGTYWKWPLPLSVKKKISHSFLAHSMRPEEIVFDNFLAIFPQRLYSQLFTEDALRAVENINPYRELMALYHGRQGDDPLDRLLYTDQKTYLVELLMKQDNMSMAASIESRVPFLDHELVEFSTRVPRQLKLGRCSGKLLLKRAMQNLIPTSVIVRKKMGFPMPLNQWLRNEVGRLFQSGVFSEQARMRGIFDIAFLQALLDEHIHGRRDHSEALWNIMNFEIWAQVFIDGKVYDSVADTLSAVA
jgi:asparagine synthase (glutamine-hydrolysing)